MEKKAVIKKNLSQVPITFTRSSYLASYTKRINNMQSCKTLQKPNKKCQVVSKTPNLAFTSPRKEPELRIICDISSIKGDNLNNSYESSILELKNIFINSRRAKAINQIVDKRNEMKPSSITQRKYSQAKKSNLPLRKSIR